MRLPDLVYKEAKTKKEAMVFGGLNLTEYAGDGEFADCTNLSVRRLPYLSTRLGRTQYGDYANVTAIYAWDKILIVDGGKLYYDGEKIATLEDGEKQFAVVNTKLCIWPDCVMLDLEEGTFTKLNASAVTTQDSDTVFTTDSITITSTAYFSTQAETFDMIYQYGSGYSKLSSGSLIRRYSGVDWNETDGWTLEDEEEVRIAQTGVGSPDAVTEELAVGDIVMLGDSGIEGAYLLNTRTYAINRDDDTEEYSDYKDNHKSGYYAVVEAIELEDVGFSGVIVHEYTVKFSVFNALYGSADLDALFEVGDKVDISGCTGEEDNNMEKAIVSAVTADTITFEGVAFAEGTETDSITLQRSFPALDYICERDNRLWGVSNEDKTIYASALGLPQRMYDYDGLSTDSYAVAVGSKGDFTACVKYSTSCLFFKENSMVKLLGNYPAEYCTYNYDIAGVEVGSHKSLKIINEVLYYKGIDGVYAYGGSTPATISTHFGERRYCNGVGGTDGVNYLIGMDDSAGSHHVFIYDTRKGLWIREDDTQVLDFCRHNGNLYLLDGAGVIYKTGQSESQEVIDWDVTFAPFYEVSMGKKVYSKLFFRLELDSGAYVKAFIRYDGAPWVQVGTITSDMATATLPIRLKRCDKFEVRLEGRGGVAVLSFVREMKVVSER